MDKIPKDGGILKFKYEGKRYKIDILKELQINPNTINSQIKDQPSNYYFLCLVRNKFSIELEKAEQAMNRAYARAYSKYKEMDYNNDHASNKASINKEYIILQEKYLELKNLVEDIKSATRSFEQRANLIQTISNNLRTK